MKKVLLLIGLLSQIAIAQVGIGTITPNSSAALDITSTDSGILIPRMSESQKNMISSPVTGLMIYQTDAIEGFWYYDGSIWKALDKTDSWDLTGNAGTNPGSNFIGTTDDTDLMFKRNSTISGRIGQTNTALGTRALNNNTSGNFNTGIGALAIDNIADGNYNTAIGYGSMGGMTGGDENVGVGKFALNRNEGDSNTALGNSVLGFSTTGEFNTAIGRRAMAANITGSYNVTVGADTDVSSSGSYSTAIGYSAVAGGNYNTMLGAIAGLNGSGDNLIAIGYNAAISATGVSNEIRLGNTAITSARIQVGWTITSDARWKDDIRNLPYGLNFISRIRPVDYLRKDDASQLREIGFIAQEVNQVLNELEIENMGFLTRDGNGYFELRYNDLIGILVKATQEQQQQIEALKVENQRLRELEDRVLHIETFLQFAKREP